MSEDAKHEATHALDGYCISALQGLNQVMQSAYDIGCDAELRAVAEAVIALHAAADKVHVLLFAECGPAH